MMIADWDRHEDQWRWAAYEPGDLDPALTGDDATRGKVYRPVAKDHDFAFYGIGGIAPYFLRRFADARLQPFGEDFGSVSALTANGFEQDRRYFNDAHARGHAGRGPGRPGRTSRTPPSTRPSARCRPRSTPSVGDEWTLGLRARRDRLVRLHARPLRHPLDHRRRHRDRRARALHAHARGRRPPEVVMRSDEERQRGPASSTSARSCPARRARCASTASAAATASRSSGRARTPSPSASSAAAAATSLAAAAGDVAALRHARRPHHRRPGPQGRGPPLGPRRRQPLRQLRARPARALGLLAHRRLQPDRRGRRSARTYRATDPRLPNPRPNRGHARASARPIDVARAASWAPTRAACARPSASFDLDVDALASTPRYVRNFYGFGNGSAPTHGRHASASTSPGSSSTPASAARSARACASSSARRSATPTSTRTAPRCSRPSTRSRPSGRASTTRQFHAGALRAADALDGLRRRQPGPGRPPRARPAPTAPA